MTFSTILKRTAAASVLGLGLSGCSTGDLGDIFGGDNESRTSGVAQVTGEVEYVDTRDDYIIVDSDRPVYISGLRNQSDEVRLYFDDRVQVEYRGNWYDPEALERGDRIAADVTEDRGQLWISRIEVTQDVSGGTSDRYDIDQFDGYVRYVDTRDREIEIEDRRSRDIIRVHYDERDQVEYQGRWYPITGLERGDEVRVEVRRSGGDYWLDSMVVLRSVSG